MILRMIMMMKNQNGHNSANFQSRTSRVCMVVYLDNTYRQKIFPIFHKLWTFTSRSAQFPPDAAAIAPLRPLRYWDGSISTPSTLSNRRRLVLITDGLSEIFHVPPTYDVPDDGDNKWRPENTPFLSTAPAPWSYPTTLSLILMWTPPLTRRRVRTFWSTNYAIGPLLETIFSTLGYPMFPTIL